MKKEYIKPSIMTIVVNVQKMVLLQGSPGVGVSEKSATKNDAVLAPQKRSIWNEED